jgi:mannan endo-1,4-beta-mannosidase
VPGQPVITLGDTDGNGVNELTVTWAPSTDNVGVTLYELQYYTNQTPHVPQTALSYGNRFVTLPYSWFVVSVLAIDARGNRSAWSGTATYGTPPCDPAAVCSPSSAPPPSSPPTATCAVAYTIQSQWSGAFQGDVKITNTGTTQIKPWALKWSFPNGQTISQIWGATQTQSGATVTATAISWNDTIAPGATVSFGFIGTWTGSNTKPSGYALNGGACAAS